MIDSKQADEQVEYVLFHLTQEGSPSERILAAWLLRVRSMNDDLKARIEELERLVPE